MKVLPQRAGVSLKSQHYQSIIDGRPAVGFFEVHAENYMVDGGPQHRALADISALYPLSLHGVGLSLGAADGVDPDHLDRFRQLVNRYDPVLVSEHLAISGGAGAYLSDLLPVPLTATMLDCVSDNIARVQDTIGRSILIENPASTIAYDQSVMTEAAFLAALVDRTGCGLLLDINNIFVSAQNFGFEPSAYIQAVPAGAVGEYHLAGHAVRLVDGHHIHLDDHGGPISAPVWQLYTEALRHIGARPTLVEWDNNIPDFDVLLSEAHKADLRAAEFADHAGEAGP